MPLNQSGNTNSADIGTFNDVNGNQYNGQSNKPGVRPGSGKGPGGKIGGTPPESNSNAGNGGNTNAPNPARGGSGFPTGSYFIIREKGTQNCITTALINDTEGLPMVLWPEAETQGHRWTAFFIDEFGVLCHAGTGLAIDVVDDVLCLRRRRPAAAKHNPWSHPLSQFSFENSQICVKFLSDPALPSCTEDLYPDDSWQSGKFVLATRPEREYHTHPLSDFSPWTRALARGIPYSEYIYAPSREKTWRVLVEPITADSGGQRTSWEVVRVPV